MKLTDIRDIKALLQRHGFHFSKSMGQNFLIEDWVPQDIAHSAGLDGDTGVLEIGPGIGPLTQQLALRAGKVAAIELDRSLLPILAETMADHPNVTIVPGDAMKLDLPQLVREQFSACRTVKACANLPYNITTPVLEKLALTDCFRAVTVMIQREVAQRLCASQGSGQGGAFSLFLQYRMETEYLFDVPPEKFLPPPKVTSAVMRCVRRDQPAVTVADEDFFFRCVRGGFLLRRKTLANSLSSALPGISRQQVQQALAECGLPADVRGERLTLEEFARLSEILSKILI